MIQETTVAEVTSEEVTQAIPEPTIEELKANLAQAKQEIIKKEQDLKSAREEAKAHQKFGQEKQAELKNQSDLRARLEAIEEGQEILAVALATKGEEEPTDGTNRQNVLAELQKRKAAAELKRQQETDALTRQEYNKRADAIYSQAQSVYGVGDEEKLEAIEDLLKSGNIVRAEQRIERVIKSKTSVPEVPKEAEEARIERLVKERMEAKYPGVYAIENNTPIGGGSRGSFAEIERQYAEGEITTEQYAKAREKQGIN